MIFGQEQGVKEWCAAGKVGSVCKVQVNSNMDPWAFVRKYKGLNVHFGSKQQWHTWDHPKEEVLLFKRVSLAVNTLRIRAIKKVFFSPKVKKRALTDIGNMAACGSRS